MRLDRLLPLTLALLAASSIPLWLFLAWRQITYPLELFGHEGAIVDHIRRLLDGQPIYGPPQIEFVPFLYTPGFYWVCAAFAWAGDLAFAVPRGVSAAATLGSMACLAWLTTRLSGRAVWGVIAVGGFALGASQVEAWYALAQVDNLFLLCLALAVCVAQSANSARGFFLAGLIFAAAFWCKQIGLAAGLLYAGVLIFATWRGALALAAGLAIGIAPGVALLAWASDGWFLFYAFEIPAGFGVQPLGLAAMLIVDVPWLLPAYLAAAFVLWRLWRENQRETALKLAALAVCLFGTAALGRAHPGGHVNTLLPAIWLMALGLGAGIGMAWNRLDTTPARLLLGGAALLQLALLAYDPARFLPAPDGDKAIAQMRARLAAAPQPILLPGAGYLVGRVAGADHVAVNDVFRTDATLQRDFLDRLDAAMRQKRYGSAAVDDYMRLRHAHLYDPYYRVAGRLNDITDAERPRAGFDYGPLWLLQAR